MKSNEIAYPKSASWLGPVALLAAVGAAGLGLGQTQGGYGLPGLVIGLLALGAALGGIWLYRLRAARHLFAVWDAYAERELARAERRPHTPRVRRRLESKVEETIHA